MAVVLDIDDLISLGSPVAKQGPRVGQSPPPQPKEQIVMTMDERITLDPAILAGKPIVRGTRLSVEFIIGLMADGWSEADILANYPGLAREDISACLAYARDVLQSEKVHPSAA